MKGSGRWLFIAEKLVTLRWKIGLIFSHVVKVLQVINFLNLTISYLTFSYLTLHSVTVYQLFGTKKEIQGQPLFVDAEIWLLDPV